MTEIRGVRIDGNSLLCGAALGTGIGALCGWLLTRRSLEKRINEEVAGVKQYYADKTASDLAGTGDYTFGRVETSVGVSGEFTADPAALARANLARKGDLPATSFGFVQEAGDEVEGDAAEDDEDDGDPGLPVDERRTDIPYIVSADEFHEEGGEHEKVSLTWWSVDKVLTDERDVPIRDMSLLVVDFHEKFGHLSEDEHIVYVRNGKLRLDIEVVHRPDSFTETVLGYGKPT